MGKFIDLTGQQFGEWKVIEYNKEAKKWLCECQCKDHTRRLIASVDLRKGKTTNCGCMRKKDLTGKQFKHLVVDSYAENYHWNCHCTECGKKFVVHTYHLEHNNIPNCTHSDLHTNVKDITNKVFGELKVIEYIGNKQWKCKCSCGKEVIKYGKDLRSGKVRSCGDTIHRREDLTNKQFNEWTVISYIGKNKWYCQCSCGNKGTIERKALINGISKSCGHNNFVNLTGQKFGEWAVLEYVGNGKYKCQCSCENKTIKNVRATALRSGRSRSCGCKKGEYAHNTLLNRYGDTATSRIANPREKWQIEIIENKDEFREYLKRISSANKGVKPTIKQLEDMLDTSSTVILKRIHSYSLEEYVDIQPYYSQYEAEIVEYIRSITNLEIVTNSREYIGNNLELDIYIPEKKLAIEFNGSYWHSDRVKDKYYHQKKTIACIKNKIRLIHIFEYEWVDSDKQRKIKQYLKSIICNADKLYARQTTIKEITSQEAKLFENEYHLQGYTTSSINIALQYEDETIGLMTFGKPRFNKNYEYELIRLCYKSNIAVVGGSEKMLKYFIDKYNPQSIISYCDLSKFDGNVYSRLGFDTNISYLTQPNYVWVHPHSKEVLTRYQTQKHKLVEKGLGTEDQTEDEIMTSLNYLKVYDSGNMKFTWNNNRGEDNTCT